MIPDRRQGDRRFGSQFSVFTISTVGLLLVLLTSFSSDVHDPILLYLFSDAKCAPSYLRIGRITVLLVFFCLAETRQFFLSI
jgi:hypothetical protein